MLKMPNIIEKNKIISKDLDYKWSRNIEEKIDEDINDNVFSALCKLNYKVVMGLAIASSEWIFWRLKDWRKKLSNLDMPSYFLYTEAHWIGLINKYYLKEWRYGIAFSDIEKNKIEPILWIVTKKFEYIRLSYSRNDPSLYGDATRIIMIARHICGNYDLFDNWLKDILKKSMPLFPNKQWENEDWDNLNKSYDSNQDPFIPRDFYFNPDYHYAENNLLAMQRKLLAQADYHTNQFLNSPEEMLNEGFQGIPYQINEK